ncbi:MAG TPA: cytochrome P450 [Burkholderiaceae bacterium]
MSSVPFSTSICPYPARTLAELPGPRGAQLLGSADLFDPAALHLKMEGWAREYGPLYRFRLLGKRMLVVSSAAQIARLLRDRPHGMRRGAKLARILESAGVSGVFTAEGDDWQRQRRLVMRALTPEIVHRYYPTLSLQTGRLLRRWQAAAHEGRAIDLQRDLKAHALDITIGIALGHHSDTLEHEAGTLQRDIAHLFAVCGGRMTTPTPYRQTAGEDDPATAAALARVQATIHDLIAATRARLAASSALRDKPASMLDALVLACDEAGSGFDEAAVAGNALTMVFAGEDTTSGTLAWLLHFLATHPQAASRARAEIEAVLGDRTLLDDHRDLAGLSYLDAAIREAMRLKPMVPILGMEPNADTEIGGVEVPAGTHVMCLPRAAAARETHEADAPQFVPERWLGQRGADDTARADFPFGGGPRFCPGRYLAMAEIKATVSMVLRNFDLEIDASAEPVRECYRFTMTPSALPVVLSVRHAV